MNSFLIMPYQESYRRMWNEFVANSKNGSFMFKREYLSYHKDRLQDYSHMIFKDDKLIALFPANKRDKTVISSHDGLSYGGLIIGKNIKIQFYLEIFKSLLSFFSSKNYNKLIYKPIPRIYHKYPADEDLYALFIHNATLHSREVNSVLSPKKFSGLEKRRCRQLKKALANDLVVSEENNLEKFWPLLETVLSERYKKLPTHNLEEIQTLRSCFLDNIRLFVSKMGNKVLSGVLIFENETVAHAQYIASSHEGRLLGGLELIFNSLITDTYHNKDWFSFGISTENFGRSLNLGLVGHKEGFDAHTAIMDIYEVKL